MPAAILSADPAPRCPRCRTPLRDDAGADVCDRCGGVWFDRGELEHVLAKQTEVRGGTVAHADPPVQYIRCPRCSTFMTPRAYERISGVTLDYCNAHGVWLDAGELERIVQFLEGSGPERLALKVADEQRLDRDRRRWSNARWARVRSGLEGY